MATKINSIKLSGGETYVFDLPSNAQITVSSVDTETAYMMTASIQNTFTDNLMASYMTNNFTLSQGAGDIRITAGVNVPGSLYLQGSGVNITTSTCTFDCSYVNIPRNLSTGNLVANVAAIQSLKQYAHPQLYQNIFYWKHPGTSSADCTFGAYLVIRKGTGGGGLELTYPARTSGGWTQNIMALYPITVITTAWNSNNGSMSAWVYGPDSTYDNGSFTTSVPVYGSYGAQSVLGLTTSNALVIKLQ